MASSSSSTYQPKGALPPRLLLSVSMGHRMKLYLQPLESLARSGLLQTRSAISQLPANIVTRIYNTLTHPRDQIAFSLACQCFAAIATSSDSSPLKLGTIPAPRNISLPYQKEHLLADLVRWTFMAPKSRHAHLKLCRNCWTYLPRHRIWMTRDGRRELRSLKRVDWAWAVMMWAKGGGKICPTCQIPEDYDDEVRGQFLQRVGMGSKTHKMVVQTYEEDIGEETYK